MSSDADLEIQKFDAQLQMAELNNETEKEDYVKCLDSYILLRTNPKRKFA